MSIMNLPRSLVLFLAMCGGGALFGAPLVLGAIVFGQGSPAASEAAEASPSDAGGASPGSDEIIGELSFTAVDLAFEPTDVEVERPGRYTVSFMNHGAVYHDLTFADGTVLAAEAGESASGEVVVPGEGLGFICSVPGHADAGMAGSVTVAGSEAPSDGGGDGQAGDVPLEPDPNAPAYVPFDPAAPPRAEGRVHDIELVVTEHKMTVAEGVTQTVWTFGDTVPAPVIRVTVGDTVRVKLVNPETNSLPHSIDFHASQVAWNDEMRSIDPGEELVYEFTADYAGVFMFHCGTAPALHHIAAGMYGMIIVEPEGGLPPVDHEFALVQSEWYAVEQGEVPSLEAASAGAPDPEFVVFNGIANQYADHPIEVPVGETVRVFVLNAGPSLDSSFHVVGTIFDSVIKEGVVLERGNAGNWGAQAVDLSPAQGAIVEMHFAEDGLYPIVTHAFNLVGKGALGLFQAGDGGPAAEGGH
jgi:nitrite reductase (NO-forming)